MKKIYISIGLLAALSGYAQDKHTEKADKYYQSYQYASAIREYEHLVSSKKADSYVYKQLADSYFYVGNTDKAAEYYSKAIATEQEAETYYRYAQVLQSQGKYQEAGAQMQTFSRLSPSDSRAIAYKSNPNYLKNLQNQEKIFDLHTTNLNSTSNDFGAILTDDNIVYFATTRGGRTDKRGTGGGYLDIYQTIYSADKTLSEPTSVTELNTAYHDGPVTVSADGNTMYFSRDGRAEGTFATDKEANVKIGKVGLYRAQKVEDKWKNIEAFPYNDTSYSIGNPSLSKDGKTLYFASDMPGGFGDTDIWKVTVNADGSYGTPENLGSRVNTAGKESFPFITEDGILYFASTGRQGFGGYDVFQYDTTTGQDSRNVGRPVNSEKDDFALSFNKSKEVGFFSSNRSGLDQLYYITEICKRQAEVIVKNAKTGELLPGVNVTLFDTGERAIKTEFSTSNGVVSFPTECDKEYRLQASHGDFEPTTVSLSASKSKHTTTEVLLTPKEVIIKETEVVLNPIYFEFNKSEITPEGSVVLDKLVEVMNTYPDMVIYVKSHTDTKGTDAYNQRLSDRRAQSTVKYVVSKGISKKRISGKGFGESELIINCGDDCTEEQDAQNRRSEFMIVKK